jgi:hypothetical protein
LPGPPILELLREAAVTLRTVEAHLTHSYAKREILDATVRLEPR